MRPRLSYANVMATIAVFIALGGTSYAVVKISGSQIKDRSIPASKIRRNSLTATEVRSAASADQLTRLVFSKANGRKRATVRDASAGPANSGIIKLSLGESATLLQSGPFTLHLACARVPDDKRIGTGAVAGQPATQVTVSTTEAHSLGAPLTDVTGFDVIQEFGPDGPATVVAPFLKERFVPNQRVYLLAPSGAQMEVQILYGQGSLGADCWANAWAVVQGAGATR